MVRVYELSIGNTLNCGRDFRDRLIKELPSWSEGTEGDCDAILAYCPIVSRVGTDVGAALGRVHGTKPAVLVILHHTFDHDYIVPDTGRFVNRQNTITVNCLFHESKGLLRGRLLDKAIEDALHFLRDHCPAGEDSRHPSDAKLPILWPKLMGLKYCWAFICAHKRHIGIAVCVLGVMWYRRHNSARAVSSLEIKPRLG